MIIYTYYIYVYIYIYSDREQNCISEYEGPTGGRRGKENVTELKYWNNPSIYEYNIMYCTVSCWTLGEHGDRERVSNGGANLIKAWYIQAWSITAKPPWTINIHFKKVNRRGKQMSFPGVDTNGRWWAQGKGECGWIW
jgi:hypothetical protein